jgi:hypothetical protein
MCCSRNRGCAAIGDLKMSAAFNNEPNEMIQRLITAPFGYETFRRKPITLVVG